MMKGGMMYSKGDIVVINFPFSDLINAKKRPMLVVGNKGEDIIGCAVTSNPQSEGIDLNKFKEGSLPLKSKVKYWQIHTFLNSLVIKKIAKVTKEDYKLILEKINQLMNNENE